MSRPSPSKKGDDTSNPSASLGDIFKQRRAAAAAASSSSSPTAGSSNSGSVKSSFLDIQREQQIQQQQQQQQQQSPKLLRRGSSGVGRDRGDRGDRGGRPGRHDRMDRSNHRHDRTDLPLEQGVIHTLLDKYGFILCADRDVELFFHYSEFRGGSGSSADDLNIGDEVEFRVGPALAPGSRGGGGGGGGDEEKEKLAAFGVKLLPKGTIYWETEDEPVGKRWKGVVEQTPQNDGRGGRGSSGAGFGSDYGRKNSSSSGEGLIRLISETEQASPKEEKGSKDMIYFSLADYSPYTASHSPPHRLGKNDIIEFTLVTERRTSKKLARKISLLESHREKLRLEKERLKQEREKKIQQEREEREAKLLEGAKLERGKVVLNKGDYGFLRSATRVEEVYFHISNVEMASSGELEDPNGHEDGASSSGGKRDNRMLAEGQEVQFYVIDDGSGKKGKLSARKICTLPKGSVEFERVLARGVTGVVRECPEPAAEPAFGSGGGGFGKNDRKNESSIAAASQVSFGKLHLQQPISYQDADDETEGNQGKEITEVLLHPDHYPGGTYALTRDGSQLGVWIRPGDVLLFDVVKQMADGTCQAIPTSYAVPNADLTAEVDNKPEKSVKPLVRLVQPSLLGRAEGVIRSIRDNYGFIHCAERNVDAYFPLYEVLPGELHMDLVTNNPQLYDSNRVNSNNDKSVKSTSPIVQKGGRINVEVGMEVYFDMSLQMLTNSHASTNTGRGSRSRQSRATTQEKESLRARRIQILPKSSIKEKLVLGTSLKAIVVKEDKQPFVGTLELEEPIAMQTANLANMRHPIISKLLDEISLGKYGMEATFPEVWSEKDAQVVISMVGAREDLDWKYVAMSGGRVDSHTRTLCILKKANHSTGDGDEEAEIMVASEDSNVNSNSTNSNGSGPATSDNSERDTSSQINPDAQCDQMEDTPNTDAKSEGAEKLEFSKKKKKEKIIKNLRFDKFSFPDASIGPLIVGDVVSCDLSLSRRSGSVIVENIAVLERKERPPAAVSDVSDADEVPTPLKIGDQRDSTKSARGFVTEVVPSRQFGFITAVDGHGSKTGEHVFFHFREISKEGDAAQDTSPASGRSKKNAKGDIIRKGDEVQFDMGPGKNGKVTATNVLILPRGTLPTLPSKGEKGTCTGYVLLEPSHTSLANTPSHIVLHSGPSEGAGRWDKVGKEKEDKLANKSGSNVKEEGVILLLSDPNHLFSQKEKKEASPEKAKDAVTASNGTNKEPNDAVPEDGSECKDLLTDENHKILAGTHLRYKLSSMALRGHAPGISANRPEGPRRGDLVSFTSTSKVKNGKTPKDIRIEQMCAATSMRGTLVNINNEKGTASFLSSENDRKYEIPLSEVVSCDKSLLNENDPVDGILHDGEIYGVCRTKDLYLTSSIGRNSSGSSSGMKERPKLNLTVKKELQGMGGQIMAQSRMAKGPDGTNGFPPGWTKRLSPFVKEFVPTFEPSTAAVNQSDDKN